MESNKTLASTIVYSEETGRSLCFRQGGLVGTMMCRICGRAVFFGLDICSFLLSACCVTIVCWMLLARLRGEGEAKPEVVNSLEVS